MLYVMKASSIMMIRSLPSGKKIGVFKFADFFLFGKNDYRVQDFHIVKAIFWQLHESILCY